MDGLVFAAGEGTRPRPLTDDTPKPLLTVGGRPILTHCLDTLVDLDVDRLVIVVGYRGDAIVDPYGDEFRGPIEYARQENRSGMAHALLPPNPTSTRTSRCSTVTASSTLTSVRSWTATTTPRLTARSSSGECRGPPPGRRPSATSERMVASSAS